MLGAMEYKFVEKMYKQEDDYNRALSRDNNNLLS